MDFTIAGMQRCTLADFPGEVACTVFTQGCNWHCPYCHNGSLIGNIATNPVPLDEVFGFLRTRRGRINAVVITGGEPTLQPGLVNFCAELKQMQLRVKLDTNGTSPATLGYLIAEGLVDYVAMDVKQPKSTYRKAAGCAVDVTQLDASIELLLRGQVDYEFRTTVIPAQHVVADIADIARWVAGGRVLYLQPFQPKNALSLKLRASVGPTETFLQTCQTAAAAYLPTLLR